MSSFATTKHVVSVSQRSQLTCNFCLSLQYYSDCELKTQINLSLSLCLYLTTCLEHMECVSLTIHQWLAEKAYEVLSRLDESHVKVPLAICVGNNGACTAKHNEHHCMCLYFQLRARVLGFFFLVC